MARRKKKVEEQMDIFEEGGLKDEGGTVDPVSGNDVPSGSTQSEVRDDIPAQLSEGEFVFPADVVRYIGLENLMELRQKAKMGLQKMEDMGQMGNSEEATINDDVAFEDTIDKTIEAIPMAMGGAVPSPMKKQRAPFKRPVQNFKIGGTPQVGNPLTSTQTTPVATQPITLPKFSSFVQQPAMQQVQGLQPVVESKEFIGPNGERVTIQFVNGQPATPVPDGYREMTAEEKAEAMKPKIEQPKVQTESNRDDPEAETTTDATGEMLDGLSASGFLSEDITDIKKDYNNKSLMTAGGFLAAGIAGIPGAIASGEMAKNSVEEQLAAAMGITVEDFNKDYVEKTGPFGINRKYNNEKIQNKLSETYAASEGEAMGDVTTKSKMDAFDRARNEALDAVKQGNVNKAKTAMEQAKAAGWTPESSRAETSGEASQSTSTPDRDADDDAGKGKGRDPSGGASGSPFAKGGAVKPKRKKGLGRLK